MISVSNKILLAHPGTQYSYQLARQLDRHGALLEFWTGFALAEGSRLNGVFRGLLPETVKRKIANRVLAGVTSSRVKTMPLVELKALKELRRGVSSQQVFLGRNRVFQERIPGASIKRASALVGFDTSSWVLAERADKFNKPFFLDQSISHPLANESILREVNKRFPEWQNGFEARLPEVLECERQEYARARRIVVASSFSRRTLVEHGVDEHKIVINPYGVDLELFRPARAPRAERPLRFLFLGLVTARKGVPLLIEAWRALNLKGSELWMVGPITEKARALVPQLPGLKVLGKRPHGELPELMRECDVLVFPSYCEGFGLVLLEALATGLPLITTEATAGPDLIEDGVEGRLVPAGDLDALCEAMREMERDPDRLEKMKIAARLCAERFSWDAYGDRWQRLLAENC